MVNVKTKIQNLFLNPIMEMSKYNLLVKKNYQYRNKFHRLKTKSWETKSSKNYT